MYFIDTETCGLHGMAVTIQYAKDDGPIRIHDIWTNPIYETLELIEKFVEEGICGFNIAFDWFHICKLYTIFSLASPNSFPENIIEELAELEPLGRDGPCLKPRHALDLMLHARKGPYQSTMERNDIRIKRIPTVLAWKLAEVLNERITFNDIYFARKKSKERWEVSDIKDDIGDMNPDFKDIVLKFAPSSALKALAVDALGAKVTLHEEIKCDFKAEECGWAPFALAIGRPGAWNGAWPEIIDHHITHWSYNPLARKYAEDDIVYTRGLYNFFGRPDYDDTDSTLACLVAAVRWRGFKIDEAKIKNLREEIKRNIAHLPVSLATAPYIAKRYLSDRMSEAERIVLKDGTGKLVLQSIADWESSDGTEHPAAQAAKTILSARQNLKKIELFDKILQAGRFHASFKVIGTLSSRMAGADGLNPQGISHDKTIRGCFPLAEGMELDGGDFDSFEVSLAAAEYKDEALDAELKSGKSIHALFGTSVYQDYSYDEITESKGTEDDMYIKAKQGVFAIIYGGEAPTLSSRLGITQDHAQDALDDFYKKHPKIKQARQRVMDMFCSMKQPGGIGTKVEWNEPKEYIESMLGFRRYFTLENKICRVLFDLATDPPKDWLECKVKVTRRDRLQTASGAVRSALYAAAFNIQSSNMRAAANHVIQSTGAEITKKLEVRIWDFQPIGINPWVVQPMNVHDEIMCPRVEGIKDELKSAVDEFVESYRELVPLIGMKWKQGLGSWADK